MNKINRGILVGMALGDGHIKANKSNARLTFIHCIAQKDYLNYKINLLHSVFGGKKPKITEFNNNGYLGVRSGKSNRYFKILHNWLYLKNKKTFSLKILNFLTPHGIAIWWMDDGSLYMKKRDGKIHAREGILSTYESLEVNKLISKWFSDNYDIQFIPVKSKGSYRLRINTTNLKLFIPIIKPYIIPSMHYKIDMKYKDKSALLSIAV